MWGNPWAGDEIEAGEKRMAELDRLIALGGGWGKKGRSHPLSGAERAPHGALKSARLEAHAAAMRQRNARYIAMRERVAGQARGPNGLRFAGQAPQDHES